MAKTDRSSRRALIAAVTVLIVLALGSAFGLAPYIVKEHDVAVVLRAGKIVREEQPGLNFRIPILEKVRHVPFKHIFRADDPEIQLLTASKQRIKASMTTMWRVCNARRFYVTTAASDARASQMIVSIAHDTLRNLTREDWTADQALQEEIQSSLKQLLQTRLDELGVCILEVKIAGELLR